MLRRSGPSPAGRGRCRFADWAPRPESATGEAPHARVRRRHQALRLVGGARRVHVRGPARAGSPASWGPTGGKDDGDAGGVRAGRPGCRAVRWRGEPASGPRSGPVRLHARGTGPVPADAGARPAGLPGAAVRAAGAGGAAGPSTRGWTAWASPSGPSDRLDTLSHGNQQRVQLIAALVNEPELLVLDEPFSGLDPLAIAAMSELLAELAAAGATVLFSSHQLDLVEDLCEDVVVIDHGRVVLAGELDGLRVAVPQRVVDVRYRGPAPDWSGLPAVEVLEAGPATTGCEWIGRPTRPRRWPSSVTGPSSSRSPTSRRRCRSCSAGRWRREGAAGGMAGRPPGAARAEPVERVPRLARDHGSCRRGPDRPAAGPRAEPRPGTSGWSGQHRPSWPVRSGPSGERQTRPVRVHRYATRAAGEAAVRNRDVDVLVLDGRQLEWPGRRRRSAQSRGHGGDPAPRRASSGPRRAGIEPRPSWRPCSLPSGSLTSSSV